MNSSTRRSLWAAFIALFVFVALAASINLLVLNREKAQYSRVIRVYEPLLEAMMSMDGSISALLAAARGYTVTNGRTEFLQQYADAIRNFEATAAAASSVTREPRDRQLIDGMIRHFEDLKFVSDEQIRLTQEGRGGAIEKMLEAAQMRRTAHDFAGEFTVKEREKRNLELEQLDNLRLALTLLLLGVSLGILLVGAFMVFRIEKSLDASIARQIRRTEAMIAGMADGVMLVDGEGRVVFINPAGVRFLGTSQTGVEIERQAEVYGFRNASGRELDPRENPAAQALSTGTPIKDVTLRIARADRESTAISMSAVPFEEDGRVAGVIVSFRDVTERHRLEEEMQIQAERAQILAEAGAFFASNIDPAWVYQAIAERVAEVLGDWAAVIIKSPDGKELRVASIYHREMSSLGIAWAFIYRQPLILGEGIFGQVAATGYPTLTTNFEPNIESESTTYHAVQMKLSSLLVLPLRSRREVLGALAIAAHDPARKMTDEKLPLAELLTERAAVAIENAQLFTQQVEARRKLEDLSRLKDEFLSIASHELRTPVTSIKGYTQLAKSLIHENDLTTSAEYLDVALDQIDRMSRLILELLDVSRIETGRLEIRRERIEWLRFVRNVVNRHQTANPDRRFEAALPPAAEIIVEGDRDRLEQVLGNLLENAVKYSPDGTGVTVKVMREAERVVTAITDSGIGIPGDELGQVFERFHRGRQVSSTNYGGLGLGLYISKQIIERHSGAIWVESREGYGTTFFFSVPIAATVTEVATPKGEQPQSVQT
ncbi:MAG TPA: ATP-binding protein [Thermoanaerobaculia bacterium]|nr:ATP-binding protein [Thermoanaerobaculia bacterium]